MSLPRAALALLIISAVVLIIGYVSFIIVYRYTSQPSFCAGCHYIEPYVESWSESPHKSVNCLDCHEPAGPLGVFHSKSRGLNYWLMDKRGNISQVFLDPLYINNRNCFTCHTGQRSDFDEVPRITRINHDHLQSLKEGIDCSSCHNTAGHATRINAEKVFED